MAAAVQQISESWVEAQHQDLSGQTQHAALTLSGDFVLDFGSGKTQLILQQVLLANPPIKIDDDFHGWLLSQAAALRNRELGSVDYDNLAEELEAMAAAERRELLRRLTTLFEHLLKLAYQPNELERRGSGWRRTVARSRVEIKRLLDERPGLKGQIEGFAVTAYGDACLVAAAAMKWQAVLPPESPWSISQALQSGFFPA
ncbi:MAG: DUF29 domain-containing protein [Deltaproteobacteria bacterium]|nr:DUF29 domain-containing protein [Deltaproteobacteria bacterium]